MSALARFVALYALMYAAFGVASPFMPAFFERRGLTAEQLGVVFGAGTAIRLVAGPLVGRIADLTRALRTILAICELLAAGMAVTLLHAPVFAPLLLMSLLQSAALAPTTTLADALAISASRPRADGRRFEYGWVRGTGSGLFVIGTLISGQVVNARGLASIIVLQAALLVGAALAASRLPAVEREPGASETKHPSASGVRALLDMPVFRRLVLVSALVLGSHAMHDTFAVIRWTAAGVSPSVVSILWSESVVAEVVVFLLVGPRLLLRVPPGGVVAIAAVAGIVRWTAVASSTSVTVLALVQPLHGLTFAALHLACMRIIAGIVPSALAATAQALYALGATATTALLTLVSGWLYGTLGATGFVAMAILCAAALPITRGLDPDGPARATS